MYINDGSGNFTSNISSLAGENYASDMVDMDKDNDLDFVYCISSSTYWIENTGGGVFANNVQIDLNPNNALYGDVILAVDLNSDSAIDFIKTEGGNGISVMVNDGNQVFTKQFLSVGTTGLNVFSIQTNDIDFDGDDDIIIAAPWQNIVGWYENFMGSPYQIQGSTYYDKDSNSIKDPADILAVHRALNDFKIEPISAIMPVVTLTELWKVVRPIEKMLLIISMLVLIVALG